MMANTVKFKKAHKLNKKQYEKGEILSVSSSIYALLIKEGIASEVKPEAKPAVKDDEPKPKTAKAKKSSKAKEVK